MDITGSLRKILSSCLNRSVLFEKPSYVATINIKVPIYKTLIGDSEVRVYDSTKVNRRWRGTRYDSPKLIVK